MLLWEAEIAIIIRPDNDIYLENVSKRFFSLIDSEESMFYVI